MREDGIVRPSKNPLIICLSLLLAPSPLVAQVVINEVLASNNRVYRDHNGDSSDWLELYNAGTSSVSLEGHFLSDDSQAPGRWSFPAVSLLPQHHFLVWCSGKDRYVPVDEILDSPEVKTFGPTLIGLDKEWRYLTGSVIAPGPPPDWKEPEFDDSGWNTGLPGFGFGDDDDVTVLPRNTGAVFLRQTFQVDDPTVLPNIVLRVRYDDGFLLYLNGERVLDVNAGVGDEEEPTFATLAIGPREASATQHFDLTSQRHLLRPGENLVAAVLLNARTNSNDLSFIPELGLVTPMAHTDFKLDRDGETLSLRDPDGKLLDAVTFPPQTTDRSYGRHPDGTGEWAYMVFPTANGPNDENVSLTQIPEELLHFDPPGGRYSEGLAVEMQSRLPLAGLEIRYTERGAEPGLESSLYQGPLQVTGDTVLRAAGFLNGRRATRFFSTTYFGLSPNSTEFTLPVMSISMSPREFHAVHINSTGRGRDSEREGFIEIFDADGKPAVATGFGLRLHGGAGRAGEFRAKKAYKAYFRGVYGDSKLRYRAIPDTHVEEFDKLVLRANFNDGFRVGGGAYVRDQVIRDLHEDMGQLSSHGSWYNLFVNMEYRGVYNVVERIDKDFFSAYFPEDGDNWDVLRHGNEVAEGDDVEFRRMLDFVRNNDLRDRVAYEEVRKLIDIENFTSYMLINIWAQNHDWPHNNWYAARPRRPDGKWIFLCWDAEFGLGLGPSGFSTDTFEFVFGQDRNAGPSVTILENLLESKTYQAFFLQQLDVHLSGSLSRKNVTNHVDRQVQTIEPDMTEDTRRQSTPIAHWRRQTDNVRSFAHGRGQVIRNFIVNSDRFAPPEAPFQRGDANSDGLLNLTDAIWVVKYFVGLGFGSTCDDALDADDSGAIDVTDVLFLLGYLFLAESPAPPPPFSSCGIDKTQDGLDCGASAPCP